MFTKRATWTTITATGVGFLFGCERESPAPPARTSTAPVQTSADERAALRTDLGARSAAAPAAPISDGTALPAGHPPLDARPQAAPGAADPRRPEAGSGDGLKLTPPADWKPVPLKSAMRKAQFSLPRAEGDTDDGELVVFDSRSLGGGGGIEENLARWRGMMTTSAGTPVPDDAVKRESLDHNGMKIALLDVTGRYTPAQMPGVPTGGPKDNYRMLAAVIEAGGERAFIRATGPTATMEKHAAAFREYVLSATR